MIAVLRVTLSPDIIEKKSLLPLYHFDNDCAFPVNHALMSTGRCALRWITFVCIITSFVSIPGAAGRGDTEKRLHIPLETNDDFTRTGPRRFTEWQPPIRYSEGIKKALLFMPSNNRCSVRDDDSSFLSDGKDKHFS